MDKSHNCIEILDDSDSDDSEKKVDTKRKGTSNVSDSGDDEVVFIGVSNRTQSMLDERLKVASRKRQRMLLNERLNRDEQVRNTQTNYNTSHSVPLNVRNATVNKKSTATSSYVVAPKHGKKADVRFNYNFDTAKAMEEQERLLRESANRVSANRAREEQRRKQDRMQNMEQRNGAGDQSVSSIVHDVTTLPSNHWTWSDPFCRLGVPPQSNYDDVKRNYRKLLLLYHPDKNRNYDDAANRFHAIKEAYETISAKFGV